MLHGASNLAAFCGHGNEPSGSIKGEEFLDELSDYQVLKKDPDGFRKSYAFILIIGNVLENSFCSRSFSQCYLGSRNSFTVTSG
jgi:hypothetical protein